MGSLLYAVELPPYGGDTLFANQYLAYERLSEGLRRTLADLTAVYTAYRRIGQGALGRRIARMAIQSPTDHPFETAFGGVRSHITPPEWALQ